MFGLVLLLICIAAMTYAQNFFHQSPEQHKLAPGWQEPGLWRPQWIMDRVFYNDDGIEEYRDRLHFNLKIDRTIAIKKSENRRLLEIGKVTSGAAGRHASRRGPGGGGKEKKKKLFEASDDDTDDVVAKREALKETEKPAGDEYYDVDGTWWWQDAAPMNYAKIKLETREVDERDGSIEKIRHEVLSDWGNLDGYAFNFRRGKIIKNKGNGPQIGSKIVGTFTVKVSPHRPMVSKDFLAFQ
jgi:hypothetical protein